MRKNWDAYFMDIAKQVASRATCDRKHVGAVIVKDRRILSTGYNGSIPGAAHCDDVGHMMENGHCVRTVHAEANAIMQAAKHGIPIEGSAIYVTASPCWPCFKQIASAGIKSIIFGEMYRDHRIYEFADATGIHLVDLSGNHCVVPECTNPRVGGLATCVVHMGCCEKCGNLPDERHDHD